MFVFVFLPPDAPTDRRALRLTAARPLVVAGVDHIITCHGAKRHTYLCVALVCDRHPAYGTAVAGLHGP